MAEEIYIGTSGYDHPELKGSFYPENLARKDFLSFYSQKFNALELNSTFYGMPTPQRMLSFYQRSEGLLKFSIKLNRLLTHEIDSDWHSKANEFKNAMEPLLEKSALLSVLIQFPESFRYTPENRIYLADLLSQLAPLPAVVEFRHRDWIKPSVFQGLATRATSIVFCDMPKLPQFPSQAQLSMPSPFIGKNAYVRFHGRMPDGSNLQAPYEYTEDDLKSFLPLIAKTQEEGKTLQLYFNNHPKGSGFKNALQLQEILKNSFNSKSKFI